MERKTGATHNTDLGWVQGFKQDLMREWNKKTEDEITAAGYRIASVDDLDLITTTLLSWADGDIGGELLAAVSRIRAAIGTPTAPGTEDEVPIFDHVPEHYPNHPRFIVLNPIGEEFNQKTGAMQSEWRALYFGAPESAPTVDIGIGTMAGIDFYVAGSCEQSRTDAAQEARRLLLSTPTAPVCPRCGERTYESSRTGRTCVISECGWKERA